MKIELINMRPGSCSLTIKDSKGLVLCKQEKTLSDLAWGIIRCFILVGRSRGKGGSKRKRNPSLFLT